MCAGGCGTVCVVDEVHVCVQLCVCALVDWMVCVETV